MSLPDWVPRFTDKFRLFFLCECGEHSKADSGDDGIPIDNTTHFASHDGYELSRPTAFFECHGLQNLTMTTAIVAPAMGHLVQVA